MLLKKTFQIYRDSFSGLSKPAWMLALVMLLNRTGAMVIPFLSIYVTKQLGFSKVDAGIVLSTFGVGSVIGSLLGGWLSDTIGSFRVQSMSLFLSAPIFALIPQFTTVFGVASIIFVLSIITETFRPANSASLTLYAKPENLTRAFSLNRMAINLGFSFGPALGGILATISYSFLFYGNAMGVLLTGFVFYAYFRYKKPRKIAKSIEKSEVPLEEKSISPYKDNLFLLFSFFCILYSMVFSQLISVFPMYYEEVSRMSQPEIGLILGYSGLFIVITEMVIVHAVERKFSLFNNIIAGTLLGGLTYTVLLFSAETWMLYVSMTLLCISEILVLPFISTVAAKRASSKHKGAYMGINALSFSIALIVTPVGATYIIQQWDYNTLWIVNSTLAVIASIGFYWIGKKMDREKR